MNSNRFDSIEYLKAFQVSGRFPAIHDDIFALIISEGHGCRFLDLCCSTGLLAQRLMKFGGAMFAMGVDGDERAIKAGVEHGVTVPMALLNIGPDTLPELTQIIGANGISAVVARRCLPELLGERPEMDRPFADALAAGGAKEVFIEGRVKTARAVNRLCDVEKEAAAIASRYRVANRRRSCLRLVLA